MERKIRIKNGKVILADRIIPHGTVLVENGTIVGVEEGDVDFADALDIDAKGNYISPGFVDIHVHGGGGHDFMDGTEEAFLKVAEIHAQHGTTSIMPTTLTAEKEDILHTLDVYEQANLNNKKGASFIGLHLEGPYFSMEQRGCPRSQIHPRSRTIRIHGNTGPLYIHQKVECSTREKRSH